jgi:amino-acid N-acetyltransferase
MTKGTVLAVLKIATNETERHDVIDFLQQQQLPVTDITADSLLYSLNEDKRIVGTAGLEIFDEGALLRSVAVVKSVQGQGYGRHIICSIEQIAKERAVNCIYLITHTAKDFFEHHGYTVIDRPSTPQFLQNTEQFSSLCPSSASVMMKRI